MHISVILIEKMAIALSALRPVDSFFDKNEFEDCLIRNSSSQMQFVWFALNQTWKTSLLVLLIP